MHIKQIARGYYSKHKPEENLSLTISGIEKKPELITWVSGLVPINDKWLY
jgi:hypothetical protein